MRIQVLKERESRHRTNETIRAKQEALAASTMEPHETRNHYIIQPLSPTDRACLLRAVFGTSAAAPRASCGNPQRYIQFE